MLYLYDDQRARGFEPFASVRPVSELVAGAWPIRDRWRQLLDERASSFLCGPRMRAFEEKNASACASGTLAAGSIVANARFVASMSAAHGRKRKSVSVWTADGRVAAVRLGDSLDAREFDDGTITLERLAAGTGDVEQVRGWWLEEVWDFIRFLQLQLGDDLTAHAAGIGSEGHQAPAHTTVIGSHPVIVMHGGGATVEPHVVLDASAGPILIAAGAHVRAFTRITGPAYIGEHTTVVGGDVSGCSIGPWCKVRGELSTSIVLGHSNKGHEGFVGHSYLGRWVNLGASTVTSNLKNTYGHVVLWTPGGLRDTGMQFLGTLFGDHVKTGIGLRLTTGTVLGAGANVFGSMPPKVVPPFAWGDGPPYGTFDLNRFLITAERVMSRRDTSLTNGMREHLSSVHRSRWSPTSERRS